MSPDHPSIHAGKPPRLQLKYFTIIACGLLFVLLLDLVGLLDGINWYNYDLFFKIRGSRPPTHQIVIVAIDETSLDRFGRWPLSREVYGRLARKLSPARAVVFDLLFTEPAPGDSSFKAALQQQNSIFAPLHVDTAGRVHQPDLPLAPDRYGHILAEIDNDGVVRRVFHTLILHNRLVPSLASTVYRNLTGEPVERNLDFNLGTLSLADHMLQTDQQLINFVGGPQAFPHYSMADILEGQIRSDVYEDRIVFVGVTAPGIENGFSTPIMDQGRQLPAVELHATILENLLGRTYITPVPGWLPVFLSGGVALLLLLLFLKTSMTLSLLVLAVTLLGLFGLSYLGLVLGSFWLPPAMPYLAVLSASVAAYVFRLEHVSALLFDANQEWERSFNAVNEAIVIQNRTGRVIQTNQAFEQDKKSLIRHDRDWTFFRREIDTAFHTVMDRFGSDAMSTRHFQLPYSNRSFEMESFPQADRHGNLTGAVHVIRDTTRRQQLEQQERLVQERMLRAQKMEAIGTLAGGVAHDFNNILTAMLGHTELAQIDTNPSDRINRHLNQIKRAALRAKDLVRQILTVARQQSDERQILDIVPIVKEGLKLFKASLPVTIQLETHLVPDSGCVFADPSQIHQVLMNLCTNAAQAMTGIKGVLRVEVANADLSPEGASRLDVPPGRYVSLSVTDSGTGMSEQTREKIFEPYFTTKAMGEGTGLGLSVVLGIVQSHGGTISVDSREGKGSTFSVFLPLAQGGCPLEDRPLETAPPRGKEHILLVDDEVTITDMLAEMLDRLGYRVTATSSGQEALDIFQETPQTFDLVITDMTMPEYSGEEMTQKVLSIRPDIPVLILTGYSREMSGGQARQLGARGLMTKPVRLHALARAVRTVLDGNHLDPGDDPDRR